MPVINKFIGQSGFLFVKKDLEKIKVWLNKHNYYKEAEDINTFISRRLNN